MRHYKLVGVCSVQLYFPESFTIIKGEQSGKWHQEKQATQAVEIEKSQPSQKNQIKRYEAV